ncbi:MAG: citrate (Si)-synthase, partial [Immundisolibacteraceae bacterium]|nr:citrate (Si)-synthase [Immundisolibacteraceae bacterium]
MSTPEQVTFEIEGKQYEFPVVTGSEDEKAIDISKLRSSTGYVTLDPAFVNTASCTSDITFLDGEKGILHYRGYPIEELAAKASFVETSYLLIYGELPTSDQLQTFTNKISSNSAIPDQLKSLFDTYPASAHPMANLSSMICTLSAFYPEASATDLCAEQIDASVAQLISQVTTLTAYSYKKSLGQSLVDPDPSLDYCANFLKMMFGQAGEAYEIDQDIVEALNLLLILHADHEQNCSTSAVRLVGSSRTNP